MTLSAVDTQNASPDGLRPRTMGASGEKDRRGEEDEGRSVQWCSVQEAAVGGSSRRQQQRSDRVTGGGSRAALNLREPISGDLTRWGTGRREETKRPLSLQQQRERQQKERVANNTSVIQHSSSKWKERKNISWSPALTSPPLRPSPTTPPACIPYSIPRQCPFPAKTNKTAAHLAIPLLSASQNLHLDS